MAISGSFISYQATQQPMAAAQAPNARHGQTNLANNAWDTDQNTGGQGAPFADEARQDPAMQARGIQLDLGHQWGHEGTPRTRNARRGFFVDRTLGAFHVNAQNIMQGAAFDAATEAHGDMSAANFNNHSYNPAPQMFAGESYTVDCDDNSAIPATSTQQAISDTTGGQFMTGSSENYAPSGFRMGNHRRWAQAHYSSPTLGAMYSHETLRGVLPQAIATPVNQPALKGVRDSGIASNARDLLPSFTLPQLFSSPPSMSDILMAAQTNPNTNLSASTDVVIDTGVF